jgi:hypothetical protein
MEVISELAVPLAFATIAALTGVPAEDHAPSPTPADAWRA